MNELSDKARNALNAATEAFYKTLAEHADIDVFDHQFTENAGTFQIALSTDRGDLEFDLTVGSIDDIAAAIDLSLRCSTCGCFIEACEIDDAEVYRANGEIISAICAECQ